MAGYTTETFVQNIYQILIYALTIQNKGGVITLHFLDYHAILAKSTTQYKLRRFCEHLKLRVTTSNKMGRNSFDKHVEQKR